MTDLEWEEVATRAARLPVPGGWLYKVWVRDSVALAFVPDPNAGHVHPAARNEAAPPNA
jgi:hypothetical protein